MNRVFILMLAVMMTGCMPPSPAPGMTPPATPAATEAPSATPPAATATSIPASAIPSLTAPPAGEPVVLVSPPDRLAAQAVPLNTPLEITRFLGGLRMMGGARARVLYGFDYASGLPSAMTAGGAARPLEFMRDANYGFDIRPADEPLLGWGTYPNADAPSRLWLSRPDGQEALLIYERPDDGLPVTLVFDRWVEDGQSFFFSQEPYGIGGYLPMAGASSLYRFWLAGSRVDVLVPYQVNGRGLCIDDLYEPAMQLAHHCDDPAEIKITSLATGASVRLAAPAPTDRLGPDGLAVSEYRLAGTARFSPDGRRVAYALIRGDPGAEQGWVAVGNAQTGMSELAWAGAPGGLFQVIGWISNNALLLQYTSPAGGPPAVWQIAANGADGYEVAAGSWIGLIP